MTLGWEDLLKVVLALFAGGLIGIEREFRDKAAGFRTVILICVGSTLFTILSGRVIGQPDARIAANIVSGVGFLGAGVILREPGERIVGLTTAALIWLVAAVGMGFGSGHYLLSGVVVALVLIVLWVFPLLEQLMDSMRDRRSYRVTFGPGWQAYSEVEELLRTKGRQVQLVHRVREGDRLTATWQVLAHRTAHEELARYLLARTDLPEVQC